MSKKITFIIESGRHYARNFMRFRLIFGRTMRIRFSVNHAAFYNYHQVINGWSKIIGLTDLHPHWNSLRLAFIHSSSGLLLGSYAYHNGKREVKPITSFMPGTTYDLIITRLNNEWQLNLETSGNYELNHQVMIPAPHRCWVPFLFVLHPYVGGRFTLERDLVVKVERV